MDVLQPERCNGESYQTDMLDAEAHSDIDSRRRSVFVMACVRSLSRLGPQTASVRFSTAPQIPAGASRQPPSPDEIRGRVKKLIAESACRRSGGGTSTSGSNATWTRRVARTTRVLERQNDSPGFERRGHDEGRAQPRTENPPIPPNRAGNCRTWCKCCK